MNLRLTIIIGIVAVMAVVLPATALADAEDIEAETGCTVVADPIALARHLYETLHGGHFLPPVDDAVTALYLNPDNDSARSHTFHHSSLTGATSSDQYIAVAQPHNYEGPPDTQPGAGHTGLDHYGAVQRTETLMPFKYFMVLEAREYRLDANGSRVRINGWHTIDYDPRIYDLFTLDNVGQYYGPDWRWVVEPVSNFSRHTLSGELPGDLLRGGHCYALLPPS